MEERRAAKEERKAIEEKRAVEEERKAIEEKIVVGEKRAVEEERKAAKEKRASTSAKKNLRGRPLLVPMAGRRCQRRRSCMSLFLTPTKQYPASLA